MGDVRLYIIGGTFALLVVSIIVFVFTLTRARRVEQEHAADVSMQRLPTAPERDMDASLKGFEIEVSADSPSASLLTPLKTEDWMPPESPATVDGLKEVALAERVAHFEPEPVIPEPAFSVEQHPDWKVGEAAAPPSEPAPTWAQHVPEVVVDREDVEPTDFEAVPIGDSEDSFDAEIAALLPTTVFEAVEGQAAAPAHVPPALEPAPVPEPVPAPMPVPEPVPEPFPAPMPVPEPTPEPALPPEPASDIETLSEDDFWQAAIRGEQGLRVPAAAAPREPRPEVRVAEPQPSQEAPDTSVVPDPEPVPPRPRVTVHVAGGADGSEVMPIAEGPAAPRRVPARAVADIPDVVMAAPVEMWFGESRVGVKAGTATYDRFRKYADVLLDDLQASKTTSR